ncbi:MULTISPECIES: hypothetical protein [Haloarcula]|uniref:Uncharacterized protein n=1 Tax=Haloarcula pellucida TaxID=1427151 RepID=A0A830GNG2_9EURY|nr:MULTISPECIES: hypothetical protein [Halomicroarcula]MBX0348018.1 hypothetical protein [Halomicroarcula pellucida]MDS0277862.1 hypothetical protein [Halomicroarcula sp. S1AR25-4]GGN96531.1 hypothetical protein GCM10009030_24900 [Halomicroarcula pellucida]
MAIAQREREAFGHPLAPIERTVAGIVLAVGVAGHAALVGAAVTLAFLLLTAL